MQAGFFDLENRLGQRQLPGDSLPELGQTGDWKAFRPVVGANLQKSGEKALNLRNRCQSPTVRTSQHEPVLVCSRVKSLRRYRLAGLMLVILLFFPSLKADARGLGWPGATLSEMECYGGPQGYGPYNYVTQNSRVGIVERHHFTPPVERLVRGESSELVGDLDYTLRAIPNHHRALWAMTRYYLRKAGQLSDEEFQRFELTLRSEPPPECYFQRAKLFAPQDGMVPAIYGIYLHKRGLAEAALQEYKQAEELLPDDAELAYNTGLVYFDLGDMAQAKEYAEKAATLGYPLTGLQRKIKQHTLEKNAN